MPKPPTRALVITHGAGSNRDAPLLLAVGEVFAERGYSVERVDLSYRQRRPTGPPRRGDAEKDREVLRQAVERLRSSGAETVILGGASYGGRQASILAAEAPELVDGLLLLSYPLHPPGKPDRLRIEHFPRVTVPALFVQGTRDPFGSIEGMKAAIELVSGRATLITVDRAGHDLKKGDGWPNESLVSFFDPKLV